MLIDSLLESIMLICFAAAWPASIHKSWTSRTRKGKSLFFLRITRVLLRDDGGFLILSYTFNSLLVFCDLLIYYRNYRIDEGKPPLIPQSTKDFAKGYFRNRRWKKRV
jgi:hypothetical protein